MEENAIYAERGLNDDFVEQFAALNIELTTSDIDGWFHADGPGYEYLDEQSIVDLVSVADGNECDEEENADENTQHSTEKAQMLFFSCRGNANVWPLFNVAPYSAGSNSFKDFHITVGAAYYDHG